MTSHNPVASPVSVGDLLAEPGFASARLTDENHTATFLRRAIDVVLECGERSFTRDCEKGFNGTSVADSSEVSCQTYFGGN